MSAICLVRQLAAMGVNGQHCHQLSQELWSIFDLSTVQAQPEEEEEPPAI